MIERYQYMANYSDRECLLSAVEADKIIVETAVREGRYISVSLFCLSDMLFLYCESEQNPCVDALLPNLTGVSEGWRIMDNVYYTCVPLSLEQWGRPRGKQKLCRIGRLVPDKISSYIKYHKLYMEEGIRKGDKYQYISLLDNTLFLYYESPVEETCLRPDKTGESMVQKEWITKNPPAHFDHSFSGEANFINLEPVLSCGREELYE